MSKRTREEANAANGTSDADRAAKKARKAEKLRKRANAVPGGEGRPVADSETPTGRPQETQEDLTGDVSRSKLSKEERRALRRARKEGTQPENASLQVENAPDSSADTDTSAKAQKAAEKLARKAARKAAKLAGASSTPSATTSGFATPTTNGPTKGLNGSPEQTPSGRSKSSGYVETPALTAQPQADIDAFVAEQQISVEDSQGQNFRPITAFHYLPVTDDALKVSFASFKSPTPIQAAAWPYLLSERDVIGVAETGSGKTMAFGVPCVQKIQRLDKKERSVIKACIVSPTRELASQIHEQMVKLCEPAGLKATCVYGGVSKDDQRALLKGTHIVVATPGRLNDFIQEGSIDLSNVNYLVLDEADRMLDTGFEQEIRKIISTTPTAGRQTLMFTATWPQSVRDLASTFMSKPVKITIGDNASGELRANARIVQEVEVIDPFQKVDRLVQLLKQYQSGKNKKDRILVFALYKKEATRIEETLQRRGFNVAGIHGDLSQQKRTESLEAFKEGKVPLLIATDVAARGLDIPAVKVVINLTFPLTVEDYVHRIGRTGRAGQDGRAITLFTEHEKGLAGALINVLKGANQPVPDELLKFGTTVKKKQHDAYGAFYKDSGDMKKATKITFD